MIRHIVMFRLEGPDADACRAAAIDFKNAIEALPAQIPQLIDARVDLDNGAVEGNLTMALTAHCADMADLAVYAAHPRHIDCVNIIRPYIALRCCVDADE